MKPNLKNIVTACLLISTLLLTACSADRASSSDVIHWRSYTEGIQAASTQGKKTFLYFRADW